MGSIGVMKVVRKWYVSDIKIWKGCMGGMKVWKYESMKVWKYESMKGFKYVRIVWVVLVVWKWYVSGTCVLHKWYQSMIGWYGWYGWYENMKVWKYESIKVWKDGMDGIGGMKVVRKWYVSDIKVWKGCMGGMGGMGGMKVWKY